MQITSRDPTCQEILPYRSGSAFEKVRDVLPLHEAIRTLRGAHSLDAFASRLGTSRQRVIAWEKGRERPSPRYMEKLADEGLPAFYLTERPSLNELSRRLDLAESQVMELRALLEAHEREQGEPPPS